MTTNHQIDRLLTLMQRLRDPENGCPWDKEQTFASIAPYTLEETYEVLDAIAREDFDDLRGELGDLLFQVVFYAQMAQEEGRFDFNDICAAISDKLERRHPHVFGELSADNSEEALVRWEQIKTEERAQKAQHSALDDIPRSFPALMRAQKIQKRCSNVGFDWTSSFIGTFTPSCVAGMCVKSIGHGANCAAYARKNSQRNEERIYSFCARSGG